MTFFGGVGRGTRVAVIVGVVVVVLFVTGAAVGEGVDSPRGSDVFGDVPVGHWADEAIGWAVENGVTTGVGEGRFGPEGVVSRGQILTLLFRTVLSTDPDAVVAGQGSIVFTSNRDGVDHAYLMDSDGGNVRQLTEGDEYHQVASLSPDGTQVAFSSGRGGDDRNLRLWVMNIDGSGLRQLVALPGSQSWSTWSPDGTQIAFSSARDGTFESFVVGVDGTGLRRLAADLGPVVYPSWSSDGTRFVLSGSRDGDWELFVMDSDGSNVRQVTDNTHGDIEPVWSADDSRLLFSSDRDGDRDLFVVDMRWLECAPGHRQHP